MNVLIVEDEIASAKKLKTTLHKIDGKIEVTGICTSVKTAIERLEKNNPPDLIFLDILLSDGLSFEILKNREISCLVIFVMAFSSYAMNAFKFYCIDYPLKPYKDDFG